MKIDKNGFVSLLVVAYGLMFWAIFLDLAKLGNASPSYFLNYLGLIVELGAFALIGVAIYLRWPGIRSLMFGMMLFIGACVLCYVEIAYMQHLFTREFVMRIVVVLLAIPIIYGIYLWARNQDEIFRVEIVNVKNKEG